MEEVLSVSPAEGLVGRDAEVAVAAGAVRQLCDGRASALVIEGEAGIGKTRLVQSIVEDAGSRDVAVFCGQAHPFERTRPFGVVAAALDLSWRSPDPRRAAIGALLAGRVAGAPARAVGDIQYRVVEEVVDLVETSCAERPVLFVAEDIHWREAHAEFMENRLGAAMAQEGVTATPKVTWATLIGEHHPAVTRTG